MSLFCCASDPGFVLGILLGLIDGLSLLVGCLVRRVLFALVILCFRVEKTTPIHIIAIYDQNYLRSSTIFEKDKSMYSIDPFNIAQSKCHFITISQDKRPRDCSRVTEQGRYRDKKGKDVSGSVAMKIPNTGFTTAIPSWPDHRSKSSIR